MFKSIRRELAYHMYRPQRILFDHLPKCAGTTINTYLVSHFPKRLVFQTNGQNPSESVGRFQSLSERSRYRYRLILGHLAHDLLDYVHPGTITLTIFRDPIDRIVSHYFYVRQNPHHYLHDRVMKSNIQLKDYTSSGLGSELRNWYTTHFSGYSLEDAEKCPEDSVRRAFDIISERYDVFGFQDNLAESVNRLRNSARLYEPFGSQARNITPNRTGLKDIPAEVKQIIAEANHLDIRLYALLKSGRDRSYGKQ